MTDEARELEIYIANTAALWERVEHIARLYERKRAKGIYDSAKAAKGFTYVVREAAHSFSREFSTGRDGMAMFPKPVRDEVCTALRDHLETEWSAGNCWLDVAA